MSEQECFTIHEKRALAREIVQMEINDLAAIEEVRMLRRMRQRLKTFRKGLSRNVEVDRAAKRRRAALRIVK